jgi:hypothetical protein
MRSHFSIVFALIAVFLWGCAALVQPQKTHQGAIQVAISNPFQTVTVGMQPVIVVAVVNPSGALTWSLTANGSNCAPTCGTLDPSASPSLSARYTPPAAQPAGAASKPTITVRSQQDPTKTASFSFTIQQSAAAISVSLSGTFQSVPAAGPTQTVVATVMNDSAGVQWTLTSGGVACTLACGTLATGVAPSLQAIYTPPPNIGSGPSPVVTITATSVTDTSKSDSFSFTIVEPSKFTYLFLLRGYDASGVPLAMGGAVAVDSNGNVTNGELDINDGGTSTHIQPLLGNYAANTSFDGITRGVLTITNAVLPGTSVHPAFQYVLRGTQVEGKIIEFDATGYSTAGTIQAQSGPIGPLPAGVYVFGLDSDFPVGRRIVENGAFQILSGNSVLGVADVGQAGGNLPIANAPMAGSVTAPDALGRGTISFNVEQTITEYAYYVVNGTQLNVFGSQLYFVQTGGGFDFGTVQAGTARGDAPSFDPSSAPFHTSIVQITGEDAPGGSPVPSPDVAIGALTIAPDKSASLTFDSNDAGTVKTGTTIAGTLTFYDTNTGRGVISFPGGFDAGFMDTAVFYLFDNGTGFIIDGDAQSAGTAGNRGFSGTLSRQFPGPYSTATISGGLIGVSGASASPAIPNAEVALSADPASGTMTGLVSVTGVGVPQLADTPIQATYSVLDPATGHGTAVIPGGFFGDFTPHLMLPTSFYLIVGNQFVAIGAQAGTPSGVTFVEAQ